jgi:hypothetical protein
MRSDYHWTGILERSLSGLLLGSLSGAFSASLVGAAVGTIFEALKPSLTGMASGWVMIACGAITIPGAAFGGACAAIWRSRRTGSIAGMIGSLFAVSYPIFLLWRYDDYSLPYSIMLIGVAPVFGAVLASILIGSLAKRIIPNWEQSE